MNEPRIAAVILTKNEERDLPACLRSLEGVVSDLVVVDSGSTDATMEIARGIGAQVLVHEFRTQADQFNWALQKLSIDADWILRIDADERLTDELGAALRIVLPTLPSDVAGLLVPLRIRFLGRVMRWGDSYPVWLLRVFRRGKGFYEDLPMDEKIVLTEGRAEPISGDLIHDIPKSLTEWTSKHNRYSDRECDAVAAYAESDHLGSHGRVSIARRRLKQGVYLRLPSFLRAFVYWFYRYFLRLGFLDGKEGMIYHFLQGFWYRFLVDAKLYEIQKNGVQRDRPSEKLEKPKAKAAAA